MPWTNHLSRGIGIILKVVLDIILFCAKQDIPLRRHRKDADALNIGNFEELFKFMCKYDPHIQNRFEQLPRNGTLMSPDVQNELLESAASLLLRKIKTEFCEIPGAYYAFKADKYKDDSKRELTRCLCGICSRRENKRMGNGVHGHKRDECK